MNHLMKSQHYRSVVADHEIGDIRQHIACSMIGRTVSLIINTSVVKKGVVAGVVVDSGATKVIVNGSHYDLSQVLTSAPAGLAA
jgi:hypothetical protein